MPSLADLMRLNSYSTMRGGGDALSPVLARWLLNLLLAGPGRLQRAVDRGPQIMADFCAEFGLGWPRDQPPSLDALHQDLTGHWMRLRRYQVRLGGPFARNIDRVGDQLGLSRIERDIVAVTALFQIDGRAAGLVDCLYPRATEHHAVEVVALAVEAPRRETARALSPDGRLRRSGLVQFSGDVDDSLTQRLDLARGLVNRLTDEEMSAETLLAEHFQPEPEARLVWDDFAHLGRDREILRDYLARALDVSAAGGANVLLAGAPGTGKTEFCRVIARELGVRAWAIGDGHNGGRCLSAGERAESLFMAQEVFADSPGNLIIFDEVEDLFGLDVRLHQTSRLEHTKAWMNDRLESNRVPTLWITNSTRRIDAAHLRRFDLALEMPPASRHLKTRLVERHLPAGLAGTRLGRSLIGDSRITPADVVALARVADSLGAGGDAEAVAADLNRVVDHRFRVVRGTGYRSPETDTQGYSLQWLNTDADMDAITAGIERSARGRILLHGPPGTGKTGFARFLAERVDRPLLRRPASALLSPFLGESEKLIDEAFREAEREGAVLMLDEADSLLAARENARQQWQVSITNEILQAMEDYDGIFIAATNLIDRLDQAAMRRFDWRVPLDWLKPEQVVALAAETLGRHGRGELNDEQRSALLRLGPVAPGDFNIAIRQAEVEARTLRPECLIAVLKTEADAREPIGKGMGFIASVG